MNKQTKILKNLLLKISDYIHEKGDNDDLMLEIDETIAVIDKVDYWSPNYKTPKKERIEK